MKWFFPFLKLLIKRNLSLGEIRIVSQSVGVHWGLSVWRAPFWASETLCLRSLSPCREGMESLVRDNINKSSYTDIYSHFRHWEWYEKKTCRIDRASRFGTTLVKWSRKSPSKWPPNRDLSAKRQLWKIKEESKCKGPEVGTNWMCSKDINKDCMAREEWRRSEQDNKITELSRSQVISSL